MKKPLKDITPADSSALPKWLSAIWAELRSAFLVGTFAAGIIVAGFNWYRATFPEPQAATADQLATQTSTIRAQVAATQVVVRQALQEYTDSLAMVRAEVEETMAKPILTNIIDLRKQVQALQRGQAVTGAAIEEQRANAQATTQELLERISAKTPDPSRELIQQMLDRLDRQEELLQTIGRKSSKQRF